MSIIKKGQQLYGATDPSPAAVGQDDAVFGAGHAARFVAPSGSVGGQLARGEAVHGIPALVLVHDVAGLVDDGVQARPGAVQDAAAGPTRSDPRRAVLSHGPHHAAAVRLQPHEMAAHLDSNESFQQETHSLFKNRCCHLASTAVNNYESCLQDATRAPTDGIIGN